jgi:hypothetical protein
MKSRARQTLDKSISALLAAIEIYNKPQFSYREESFTILLVNAWELLLKARILHINSNKLNSIVVYENRRLSDGSPSKKRFKKKNRSGNDLSIGLFKAFDQLVNVYGDTISPTVRMNLDAVCEIRDNAVHFLNKDLDLRKKVYELGTASVKNYMYLVRSWFGTNLSDYQVFLMPIAILNDARSADVITSNNEEKNLLNYVSNLEEMIDDDVSNDVNLTLDVSISFKRSSDSNAKVTLLNTPDAVEVHISEEDFRDRYPWDYGILRTKLKARYSDFIENNKYHTTRKKFEKNDRLCMERFLDPIRKTGTPKKFYSSNILKEFDKIYRRNGT